MPFFFFFKLHFRLVKGKGKKDCLNRTERKKERKKEKRKKERKKKTFVLEEKKVSFFFSKAWSPGMKRDKKGFSLLFERKN